MLTVPIKSLAFDLRHQVVVNTLHFTDFDVFDKKMDTVIETAVQKLGYREKNFRLSQLRNLFPEKMFLFPCRPAMEKRCVMLVCL